MEHCDEYDDPDDDQTSGHDAAEELDAFALEYTPYRFRCGHLVDIRSASPLHIRFIRLEGRILAAFPAEGETRASGVARTCWARLNAPT